MTKLSKVRPCIPNFLSNFRVGFRDGTNIRETERVRKKLEKLRNSRKRKFRQKPSNAGPYSKGHDLDEASNGKPRYSQTLLKQLKVE